MRVAALILALAMTAASAPQSRESLEAAGIAVGLPFPDLVLPALEDGRPTSIADYRGRKVLLHVFASW